MNKKYKNSVLINGDSVTKKYKGNLKELFEYLDSRGFDNYPEVINIDENNITTKYIEENDYYELIEGEELITTLAKLHYKTLFFKNVSKNKYKDIYNKLLNNIEYLEKYNENIITNIENEIYMSPSQYLYARNYSAISNNLKFARDELKKWYRKVENKTKERVCTLHNNINLNHFIKGDKNYLISWDNYMVDTPVLDLYKFYKNDGYKLDFKTLLEKYNEIFNLLEEEKMLLNILISIPYKVKMLKNEYENTINIKKYYDYIYSSFNIIKK